MMFAMLFVRMNALWEKSRETDAASRDESICDTVIHPRKILLLDDQTTQATVSELRHSLIAGREMVTAANVSAATTQLEADTVDGVVANLRDSDANFSFLESIAQSKPSLLRFLLADSTKLSPVIAARHCVLPEVWDAASLTDAICRNFAIAHWKTNPALVTVMGDIHKI